MCPPPRAGEREGPRKGASVLLRLGALPSNPLSEDDIIKGGCRGGIAAASTKESPMSKRRIPMTIALARAQLDLLEHLAKRDGDQRYVEIYDQLKPHCERRLRRMVGSEVVSYGPKVPRQPPLFPDERDDPGAET